MAEKEKKETRGTGFAAPTIGTVVPDNVVWRDNGDGTRTPMIDRGDGTLVEWED